MKDKNKWGWIAIWRKLREHWLWEDHRPRTKFEAWIDLLWLASHDDTKKLVNGNLVKLKTGQRDLSIRFLMNRWQWSNTKTQTFLRLLREDGMISTQTSTGQIVISICNYETYQKGGLNKNTPISTEVGTPISTGVGTPISTQKIQREQLKTIKTINNNLKKESDFSFEKIVGEEKEEITTNGLNQAYEDYNGNDHIWSLGVWKKIHMRFGLHMDSYSGYLGLIVDCYRRIGKDKVVFGVDNFLKDDKSEIKSIRYFFNQGIDKYLIVKDYKKSKDHEARNQRLKEMIR